MKKTFVFALALVLVAAFVVPSFAIEYTTKGTFRTRYQYLGYPTGQKGGDNVSQFDQRFRLQNIFTASEDLALRWQLEIGDIKWGSSPSGDIGTDGVNVETKHLFVEFRTGAFRTTAGLQGAVIGRGIALDTDFAGVVTRYQPGTTADMLVPVAFIRAESTSLGNESADVIALWPYFPMGNMVFNPYFAYGNDKTTPGETGKPWWIGLDFTYKADKFSVYADGVYLGGSTEFDAVGTPDVDNKAYALAFGGNYMMDQWGFFVDAFMSTGEDLNSTTTDNEAYDGIASSYYWAELMGSGVLDGNTVSVSGVSLGESNVSNLTWIGGGATFAMSDKLKWKGAVYYANFTEKILSVDGTLEDEIGIEFDLGLTYQVMEGLKLDLVGAFLSAGDAFGKTDTEDPVELGARLQFDW